MLPSSSPSVTFWLNIFNRRLKTILFRSFDLWFLGMVSWTLLHLPFLTFFPYPRITTIIHGGTNFVRFVSAATVSDWRRIQCRPQHNRLRNHLNSGHSQSSRRASFFHLDSYGRCASWIFCCRCNHDVLWCYEGSFWVCWSFVYHGEFCLFLIFFLKEVITLSSYLYLIFFFVMKLLQHNKHNQLIKNVVQAN